MVTNNSLKSSTLYMSTCPHVDTIHRNISIEQSQTYMNQLHCAGPGSTLAMSKMRQTAMTLIISVTKMLNQYIVDDHDE